MVTILTWVSTSSQFHSAHLFCCLQSESIGGCVPLKVCLSGRLEFRWPKIDQKRDFQHYCPCHATMQPLSTPGHLHYCPCPTANDYSRNHYESCGGTNSLAPPVIYAKFLFIFIISIISILKHFHSINSVIFNGEKKEGNRLKTEEGKKRKRKEKRREKERERHTDCHQETFQETFSVYNYEKRNFILRPWRQSVWEQA